eukprot:SM000310S11939  [mRNA]  locus=s310:12166:16351:+ [translate_table: standard]
MAGEWRRQLLRAARAQWTAAAGNTAGPTSRRLLGDAAGTVAAAAGAAGRAAADPAPTTTNVQRSMLWALFARQGVLRRPPPLSRALSDSGYVDRRGVEHFKRRGVEAWLPSSAAQAQSGGGGGASSGRTRTAAAVLVVVAGGVAYVVATHMEVVPYTKRRHVVLISPETERRLGESEFQKADPPTPPSLLISRAVCRPPCLPPPSFLHCHCSPCPAAPSHPGVQIKSQFKDNILPDLHPVTIKVRRVATKIIQAAYAGVDADDWGKVHDHDPRHISADDIFGQRAEDKHRGAAWGLFGDHAATAAEEHRRGLAPSAAALSGGGGDKEAEAGADEHLEEDTWIERSRAARGGERPATRHLEGLKWEVVVVDKNVMNAFCLPGGKICVFTGLLKLFPHEAEIATVLGHEVLCLPPSFLPLFPPLSHLAVPLCSPLLLPSPHLTVDQRVNISVRVRGAVLGVPPSCAAHNLHTKTCLQPVATCCVKTVKIRGRPSESYGGQRSV